MLESGLSQRIIAEHHNVSQSAISCVWNRFLTEESHYRDGCRQQITTVANDCN